MKTVICGYSGSGKSTLAAWIGKQEKSQVLHLDTVQFKPGWQVREQAEGEGMVQAFLEENQNWVIDGNYTNRFCWEERMVQADRILVLKLNRVSCLCRVLGRYFRYQGRTRESMAMGCEEKLDWEFVLWVIRDGRKGRNKEAFRALEKKQEPRIRVVKSQRALNRLYKSLEQEISVSGKGKFHKR